MADYSAFGTSNPSGMSSGTSPGQVLGLEFWVTAPAALTTYRLYRSSTSSYGTPTARLYRITGTTTGTEVAASDVTFDMGSTTGWKEAPLTTPIALEVGVKYRAAVLILTRASYILGYFASGGDGEAGFTNGPLVVPGAAAATNSSQMTGATSSSMIYPPSATSNTWYGLDIWVSDAPAPLQFLPFFQ